MQKVLIVTTVIGTVNTFLVPHIKLLLGIGYDVEIAANCKKKNLFNLEQLNCKIHDIDFKRNPLKLANYKAYKEIKELILKGNYDLVHVHTPIASFITRIASRNVQDLKILYTAHGFHFYKGAPLKNWTLYYPIEKLLSSYTNCLITINEEDYNIAINKMFKTDEIKLVHGVGVDLNKFEPQTIEKKLLTRKEYGYKEDDFILFYAAELNYNKHQDLLVNVICILKDNIPNIKLLLAGRGPLESQYKEQVKQLGIGDYIEFLGHRGDIPNLLMLSDIAVASSRREGLPVNVMEAMATGLPLVVTDVRGHRDLVNDGENGYVIGLNDIEGFAKSIEKLHKDNELRYRLGRRGLELVQKYSLDNVLIEMESLYKEYLRGDK